MANILKQAAIDMAKAFTKFGLWQGGGGESGEHIYSTSEHIIGRWVDGSNVYEKTYIINNPVNESSINLNIEYKDIVSIIECSKDLNNIWSYSYTHPLSPNNYGYWIYIFNDKIEYRIKGRSVVKSIITIRYTK